MTKTRIKIYLIIFIILFFSLIVSVFGLLFFKKDKNNNSDLNTISTYISSDSITQITWEQAINLLQECQIKTVFQKHNLEVTLTDKNNQIFKTTEPKIDDIFNQTSHLRSDCNDIIQTITE